MQNGVSERHGIHDWVDLEKPPKFFLKEEEEEEFALKDKYT